jgi:hypothetical protein
MWRRVKTAVNNIHDLLKRDMHKDEETEFADDVTAGDIYVVAGCMIWW